MYKNITISQYNYLNLPQQISNNTDATNEINFLYDAAGIKLRKQTKINNAPEKKIDYIGNFVYEDNELRYILTSEGRVIVNSDRTYEYQYFLKDHLGNTRVTFSENGDVIQEDAYYPFGMQMNGLCYETGEDYKNKYLYNGKELQDEFGLDWYDYRARFYDAQIGRWNSIDPLSEWHFNFNNYHYCFNNPISNVDIFGLDTVPVNQVDWPDFDPDKDVVELNEVEIKGKKTSWLSKLFKVIGRFFYSIGTQGNGGEQPGGIHEVTEGEAISPTKYTAKNDVETMNMDLLLLALGNASAGTFQNSSLDLAKSLKSVADIPPNASCTKPTSDMEIIEKNTGKDPKTDAKGHQIKNNKSTKTNYLIAKEYEYHAWPNGKHGAFKKGDTVEVIKWRFNSSTYKWTIYYDSIYLPRK